MGLEDILKIVGIIVSAIGALFLIVGILSFFSPNPNPAHVALGAILIVGGGFLAKIME